MLQVDAGNRPSAQDLYVVFTILSDSKSPEKANTDLMLVEKICRPLSEQGWQRAERKRAMLRASRALRAYERAETPSRS